MSGGKQKGFVFIPGLSISLTGGPPVVGNMEAFVTLRLHTKSREYESTHMRGKMIKTQMVVTIH